MKLHRRKVDQPMWNDPESPRELPGGFRLVTSTPKQAWVDHQLVWVFVLGWAPVDIQGRRWTEDRYLYVARYHQFVPDEMQMGWAIQDFTRELDVAEVIQSSRRHAA